VNQRPFFFAGLLAFAVFEGAFFVGFFASFVLAIFILWLFALTDLAECRTRVGRSPQANETTIVDPPRTGLLPFRRSDARGAN
jgi:hypothetical protein